MKRHETTPRELEDLRAVVARDLEDASIEELSDDRRFATAYNAALQSAKMVIACAGYRVAGQGHHETTFNVLALAMGDSASKYATFFDTCRRKRNRVEYDMSGLATRTEVEQLIQQTRDFVGLVEKWIAAQSTT